MNTEIQEIQLNTYPVYKDSGVEWLGEIPEHWEVKKLKFLSEIKTGYTPLTSDTENFSEKGTVWVKPDNLKGFIKILNSKERVSYKGIKNQSLVLKGSVLVCSIGSIGKFGIAGVDLITNQQINSITFNSLILTEFGKYLIANCESEFNKWSNGNVVYILNTTAQKNIYYLRPPRPEQTAIANFLDDRCSKIDAAVEIKQQQIALLKERRQIAIHQAVTQGLDKNVPMKDSGVEWIGEIPEHWNIIKGKYLFNEIDQRSKTGNEELLSVSHLTGVTPRSEKTVTMFKSEDYTGSKLCIKNDLVYNIMWAWMGALGVSDREGIVSSAYAIYRQKDQNAFNPWYLEKLLSDVMYVSHYNRVSTGLHSSRLRFYSHMFFDMKIGFPPKDEQDQIVKYLKELLYKIDSAISLYGQEIEKLKEYKTTLINSAVTGKMKIY